MRGGASFTRDMNDEPGQKWGEHGTKPTSWGKPGSGAIVPAAGTVGTVGKRVGQALVAAQAALAVGQ